MVAVETLPDLDRVQRLDVADGVPGYLITDDRFPPIRLSPSALHLLQAVRSGMGWDELARHATRQGRPTTAAEVEATYDKLVARLMTLRRSEGQKALPKGFWLRRTLAHRRLVERAVSPLTPLFALWPALILGSAIGLAFGHFLSSLPLQGIWAGSVLLPAYALFIVSMMAHELGHAAACRRFGAKPNDIGFTIYWIFPAFYSDVTDAWRLDRWQRVVVDLGGVYFQLSLGAVYWLAYLLTGWLPLAAACPLVLGGSLIALNPFFKLDGYWLLSDALGVPRLNHQPKRLWRHAVAYLKGQANPALPWPRWVTVALAVYTPASLVFFAYFFARLVPELWARVLAYPALLSEVIAGLITPTGDLSGAFQRLLVSTFLVFVFGLMIRALARRLILATKGSKSRASTG